MQVAVTTESQPKCGGQGRLFASLWWWHSSTECLFCSHSLLPVLVPAIQKDRAGERKVAAENTKLGLTAVVKAQLEPVSAGWVMPIPTAVVLAGISLSQEGCRTLSYRAEALHGQRPATRFHILICLLVNSKMQSDHERQFRRLAACVLEPLLYACTKVWVLRQKKRRKKSEHLNGSELHSCSRESGLCILLLGDLLWAELSWYNKWFGARRGKKGLNI